MRSVKVRQITGSFQFVSNRKRHDGRPQELVANVFRCLVSILKDEDGSVITPLLNTGDQVTRLKAGHGINLYSTGTVAM